MTKRPSRCRLGFCSGFWLAASFSWLLTPGSCLLSIIKHLRQLHRSAETGLWHSDAAQGQPRVAGAQVGALEELADGMSVDPHLRGDAVLPPAIIVTHDHDLPLPFRQDCLQFVRYHSPHYIAKCFLFVL